MTRISTLVAAAAITLATTAVAQESLTGLYTVEGRNPDGSTYTGQLSLAQNGAEVTASWKVGNDSFLGSGTLEGRVLTINWYAETPVVYVVMPDGTLHGTWSDGYALERAQPSN